MHFHPTPEGSGYSRAKYRKAEKMRGTLLFHAPSINQLNGIMKNIRFEPSYYEWHLVGEDGRILLNIPDSIVDYCETMSGLCFVIEDLPRQASDAVSCGEELYGVDVTMSVYEGIGEDKDIIELTESTLATHFGIVA